MLSQGSFSLDFFPCSLGSLLLLLILSFWSLLLAFSPLPFLPHPLSSCLWVYSPWYLQRKPCLQPYLGAFGSPFHSMALYKARDPLPPCGTHCKFRDNTEGNSPWKWSGNTAEGDLELLIFLLPTRSCIVSPVCVYFTVNIVFSSLCMLTLKIKLKFNFA